MNQCVEAELYDEFASRLRRGEDVVDQSIYEKAITSRKNLLISDWLPKEPCLVLDYGCGSGESSRFISHLNHEVVAFDLSKGMIKFAKSIGVSDKISYLIASGEELPIRDGIFDVVIGIGIFHHLHLLRGLRECYRSLKPKGMLGLMEPNTLNPFSFIGKRFLRTRIHTPQERTYTVWLLRDSVRRAGFDVTTTNMVSFVGYTVAFLSAWLDKRKQLGFKKLVPILRKSTSTVISLDKLFEGFPLFRNTCWIIAMKLKRIQ
jgi:SAM-dependent methyltransferase